MKNAFNTSCYYKNNTTTANLRKIHYHKPSRSYCALVAPVSLRQLKNSHRVGITQVINGHIDRVFPVSRHQNKIDEIRQPF
jgi:hypothetical protein